MDSDVPDSWDQEEPKSHAAVLGPEMLQTFADLMDASQSQSDSPEPVDSAPPSAFITSAVRSGPAKARKVEKMSSGMGGEGESQGSTSGC